MGYKRVTSKAYSEEDIQKAITSWKNKHFSSIRATAIHFQAPAQTLCDRMARRKTKAQAREDVQLLSNAEEKTLVRWTTRLDRHDLFPDFENPAHTSACDNIIGAESLNLLS